MTELLERLRGIGLPMVAHYAPSEENVRDEEGNVTEETITTCRYIAWTTDSEKSVAAESAGATIRSYVSQDPRFTGWEVSCNVVVDDTA